MPYSWMISGNLKLVYQSFVTLKLIFENFQVKPFTTVWHMQGRNKSREVFDFTRPVGQNMAIIDVMLP